MSKSRKKLIDEIFTGALDLAGSARKKFVDEKCEADPELKSEISALLQAAETPDDELDSQVSGLRDRLLRSIFQDDPDAAEDLSGQNIRNWKIEKKIARGGLATVYVANRNDGEFEQKAAFKVLRRGLDTDDLIARFRTERQILSTLEHPCIAQILDGGALEDGRPYLVLEYVGGIPITDYCSQNKLSVRARVELMLAVLRALHHAHTRLVVHRDVKPSNILVSPDGNVSLLDFGIAKLLDPGSIPGVSPMTRTGVSLLTPGYGSPEQHAGKPVTTVSDIYQCGLVLYEMLTGQQPSQSRPDLTVPLVPSRALRGKPGFRDVRGDLDAIIRKATRGDPEKRYASAVEMVSDLQRYLDGRPVIAQPDSFGYRVSKLAKRNRWLIPVVAVGAISIAGYVASLTQHNQQLQVEKKRANAAQEFLVDLLRSADPYAPASDERGSDITVVEALDIGVERLRSGLYEDPTLKASLLTSIADVYVSLDKQQQAIAIREEALLLQRELYGDTSAPAIESVRALAKQYVTTGDYVRADKYYAEQLLLARSRYTRAEPELGVAEAAAAGFQLGRGNRTLSEQLLRDGISKMRRKPREFTSSLVNAEVKLAALRLGTMRDETLDMLAGTQRLADSASGPDSLQAAFVHAQTATSLSSYGEYEAAEGQFQQAIGIYEARLGRDHGATLAALNNLGVLYTSTGRFESAENIYRELLQKYLAKYGPKHRGVAESYQNLAFVIGRLGRIGESIPLHRLAIESYRAVLNEDNPSIAIPLLSIASAELKLGNMSGAEGAAQEALEWFRSTTAIGSTLEGIALCLVGVSLEGQGKASEGGAMLENASLLIKPGEAPEAYRALCRLAEH